jgi:copper(I)-binding protein
MHSFCLRITTFAAFGLAVALSGCKGDPKHSTIEVTEAWVRLPAVPGRPGAGYFTIHNEGPAAILTAVNSPEVKQIELHENQSHGGAMHMAPLAEVGIPANATVSFAPSGKHAMLFGLDAKAQAGGSFRLTFHLRDGRSVQANARLVSAGAAPPYAE